MDKSRAFAPVLVAILFFGLPLLYLASYFALVQPKGTFVWRGPSLERVHYRHYHSAARFAFWPVEQIDRRVRPREWDWRPLTVDEYLALPRVVAP